MLKENNSPYNVGQAPPPVLDLDVSTQIKRYKDEENTHKAPHVLPFNFNAASEVISELYKNLLQLRKMLIEAESNPTVKRKGINPILAVVDNIGAEITQTLPELLDKLEL